VPLSLPLQLLLLSYGHVHKPIPSILRPIDSLYTRKYITSTRCRKIQSYATIISHPPSLSALHNSFSSSVFKSTLTLQLLLLLLLLLHPLLLEQGLGLKCSDLPTNLFIQGIRG
jgi:hypothetical protein